MDVPNGLVSLRPAPGLDGRYDAGSEVYLEAVPGFPDVSFVWTGVDRQARSAASVIIGDDRFVMIEINLPTPAPASTSPAPTVAPTPEPGPTAIPARAQLGWIGGTVRERWAGRNYPKANVTVEGQLSGHKTTTDSEGRYTLFLPEGFEIVTFSSPDSYYPGVKALNVKPGVDIRTVNFAYDHGDFGPCLGKVPFTVKGMVFVGSDPVAGARVWFWDTPHETATDRDGSYSIERGCGELILAELGDLRGGVVVKPVPDSVIQAPGIRLAAK